MLETWRRVLEMHGFHLSRNKTKYMECKFKKLRSVSNLEICTYQKVHECVVFLRW